jgi:hypothetical protein
MDKRVWEKAGEVGSKDFKLMEDLAIRKDEAEADQLAALLAYNAGYSPMIGVQVLNFSNPKINNTGTHGDFKTRLARVRNRLDKKSVIIYRQEKPFKSADFVAAKNFALETVQKHAEYIDKSKKYILNQFVKFKDVE